MEVLSRFREGDKYEKIIYSKWKQNGGVIPQDFT